MRLLKPFILILCIATLFACNNNSKTTTNPSTEKVEVTEVVEPSRADELLSQIIKAHGGDLYDSANYSFVFRDQTFQFKNDYSNYEYSKSSKKGSLVTLDRLKNGQFSRTENGDTITLSEKDIKNATGSINSVIYFATLPYKLQDASVNSTYVGETSIKGKNYSILGITFKQEGGGEDFDDSYLYWINNETKKIDYFAYDYTVNDGGVRFRSAYNQRVIDGITFQDYSNFKAPVGTPLIELPSLYEAGKLKELPKIDTENAVNLNSK